MYIWSILDYSMIEFNYQFKSFFRWLRPPDQVIAYGPLWNVALQTTENEYLALMEWITLLVLRNYAQFQTWGYSISIEFAILNITSE